MKIDRQLKDPSLYAWASGFPMPGLVVKRHVQGYGYGYYVYSTSDVPGLFGGRGNPIAELYGDRICLFETTYFSDMERLAMAYEQATGHEITLKYWQSPKDNPPASAEVK